MHLSRENSDPIYSANMACPPPPPPLAKPGRIRVYRAIEQFTPRQEDELGFCVDDILYLKEAKEGEKYCEAKSVQKSTSGLFPKERVEDHLELIEFPLHEAAKMGDLDFLNECLDNKVSVNGLDKSGSTALHWAAYTGHTAVVARLLDVPNVALSAPNKLGDTPLHAAAAKGRLECARLLVEAGANVHAGNRARQRPVDVALAPEIGALLRTTMNERPAGEEDYLVAEEDEEEEDEEQSNPGSE